MVSIINEIVLGWGWWEEAMGSEAGMGVSVGGDFAEEEDGGDLGEDVSPMIRLGGCEEINFQILGISASVFCSKPAFLKFSFLSYLRKIFFSFL